MTMRHWVAIMAVVSLAGCRYRPEPVPLQGDREELRRMAGRWTGWYAGLESGRRGTVSFRISANADSAFGDVLLTVPGGRDAVFSIDPRDVHLRHAPSLQSLNINFVRIAGGDVRGTIEPYRAPDCECAAHTLFTGTIVADTIRGTFTTRLADGRQQAGTWRMTRARR